MPEPAIFVERGGLRWVRASAACNECGAVFDTGTRPISWWLGLERLLREQWASPWHVRRCSAPAWEDAR